MPPTISTWLRSPSLEPLLLLTHGVLPFLTVPGIALLAADGGCRLGSHLGEHATEGTGEQLAGTRGQPAHQYGGGRLRLLGLIGTLLAASPSPVTDGEPPVATNPRRRPPAGSTNASKASSPRSGPKHVSIGSMLPPVLPAGRQPSRVAAPGLGAGSGRGAPPGRRRAALRRSSDGQWPPSSGVDVGVGVGAAGPLRPGPPSLPPPELPDPPLPPEPLPWPAPSPPEPPPP
jgi:hypothetical protein